MSNLQDYSRYSIPQLLQVESSIDPNAAGENYRLLKEELEKRSVEIENYRKLQEIKKRSGVFNKFLVNGQPTRPWYVYLICIWPFFSFFVFVGNIFRSIFNRFSINESNILYVDITLFILSIILCVGLFRLRSWAYNTFGIICILLAIPLALAAVSFVFLGGPFYVPLLFLIYSILCGLVWYFVFKKTYNKHSQQDAANDAAPQL